MGAWAFNIEQQKGAMYATGLRVANQQGTDDNEYLSGCSIEGNTDKLKWQ